MIKVILAILVALVIIATVYLVGNTVVELFNGVPIGEGFDNSLRNITFGIISDETPWDVEYSMANAKTSTWENTTRSW